MASPLAPLTEAQKELFLKNGYLKLTDCFTREQAAEVCEGVWTRLGMSPTDKSTWTKGRTNMPPHRTFDVSEFAPKVWSAICELCGGEERIELPKSREWRDSLIVNLGTAEGEGKMISPRDLPQWHVDGDFFVHYLDSPEQALLVIPLFTDIVPRGGGTVIFPKGIDIVAKWLHAHPEGMSPWMQPRGSDTFKTEKYQWYKDLLKDVPEEDFIEATGDVGDVYLLHPLMMHVASSNPLRNVRIITNPPVSLNEPHCFDRADGNYSLVEKKTMQSVGGEEMLRGWKITGPREAVVPERVRIWEKMKQEEAKRMEEEQKMSVNTTTMAPLELTLVVAATRNMGIGRNGTLPWTGLKKEMAYFARVTKRLPSVLNQPSSSHAMNAVIMGRKTWDSIPPKFRPLKGRLNIVISRSHVDPPASDIDPETEAVKVGSLEQATEYLQSAAAQPGKVFVIGGAQIYASALQLPEAKRVLLTRVTTDFECDTFFPLQLSEEEDNSRGQRWVRKSKDELDSWTGETVPEGVQEENEIQYEFQMWERVE
ncbi:dihydrofolate reductase-like domain-containing protein [Xylaria bambusicola]|uniref:dihydrofolate reductase-like domain-containing protein n=1 Tax=Xylaria bambusicola TaxID=326684 RepID=UPI002007B443|nr:dihydrofolate reductase-like domain-containing protein [Xylaria bambusicola]KAI0527801.1 dihydrofolate reductase-like domain-containing protein [Xylaria bambusicola]